MTGSYGMAVVEAVVIICGIFLLVYNVMQISMSGDIRQMALLHTIGTTKKQIRKIYIRQIMWTIVPGCITGTVLSVLLLRYLIPELVGRQYLNGYGGAEELQIFRYGNLVVSGSLHVTGNSGGIGTGDQADGKQNLYRGNALHGADRKKEKAS